MKKIKICNNTAQDASTSPFEELVEEFKNFYHSSEEHTKAFNCYAVPSRSEIIVKNIVFDEKSQKHIDKPTAMIQIHNNKYYHYNESGNYRKSYSANELSILFAKLLEK